MRVLVFRARGFAGIWLVVALAAAGSPSCGTSTAQRSPMRLLQTGCKDGRAVRQWVHDDDLPKFSAEKHEITGRCGNFIDVTEDMQQGRLDENGCDSVASEPATKPSPTATPSSGPDKTAQIKALIAQEQSSRFQEHVAALADTTRFPTRYHTSAPGLSAPPWIRDRFVSLKAGHPDVEVALISHTQTPQNSVVARIKGTGPLAAEKVILGAHLDSINQFNTNDAPGANDDASGVAALMLVFETLAKNGVKCNRTLEIMSYAAEEVGLVGSKEIAAQYKAAGAKVVGHFQLDMTGYGGYDNTISLGNDAGYTSSSLTSFTSGLVTKYVQVPWKYMTCGYGCSDHASWALKGYPAVFASESDPLHNPTLHSPQDQVGGVDKDFAVRFAKLATAFAVEMCNP